MNDFCTDLTILVLECGKCKKRYREAMMLPMTVAAATARMKAQGVCPFCGHSGAFLVDSEYDTMKENVFQAFYRYGQIVTDMPGLKPAYCMDCRLLTIDSDKHKDHFLVHSYEEFDRAFTKYVFKDLNK